MGSLGGFLEGVGGLLARLGRVLRALGGCVTKGLGASWGDLGSQEAKNECDGRSRRHIWLPIWSKNGPRIHQKSMPRSIDFSMLFWVHFGMDLGSQNLPKIDQKSIPKSMKSRSP